MYGNVVGGHRQDQMGELHADDVVHARYHFDKDHTVALVGGTNDPNAKWFFVKTRDLELPGPLG